MHVFGLQVVHFVESRHSRQKPTSMHNIQRVDFNVKSVVQAVAHGSHEKLSTGDHLEVNDLEVLADENALGADARKPSAPGTLHGAGSCDNVLDFVVCSAIGEFECWTEGGNGDTVQFSHISSPDDRFVGKEVKCLVRLQSRMFAMFLSRRRLREKHT